MQLFSILAVVCVNFSLQIAIIAFKWTTHVHGTAYGKSCASHYSQMKYINENCMPYFMVERLQAIGTHRHSTQT